MPSLGRRAPESPGTPGLQERAGGGYVRPGRTARGTCKGQRGRAGFVPACVGACPAVWTSVYTRVRVGATFPVPGADSCPGGCCTSRALPAPPPGNPAPFLLPAPCRAWPRPEPAPGFLESLSGHWRVPGGSLSGLSGGEGAPRGCCKLAEPRVSRPALFVHSSTPFPPRAPPPQKAFPNSPGPILCPTRPSSPEPLSRLSLSGVLSSHPGAPEGRAVEVRGSGCLCTKWPAGGM